MNIKSLLIGSAIALATTCMAHAATLPGEGAGAKSCNPVYGSLNDPTLFDTDKTPVTKASFTGNTILGAQPEQNLCPIPKGLFSVSALDDGGSIFHAEGSGRYGKKPNLLIPAGGTKVIGPQLAAKGGGSSSIGAPLV